ncbi:MAG: HD domain-containing phosphohydrolase [Atribacterota bacterium]
MELLETLANQTAIVIDNAVLVQKLVHSCRGTLLHDIGKMGIPDSILLKPGPLSPEDWEIMKKHPLYAYQMFSRTEYLPAISDIPYAHHERRDGTGHPRGLKVKKFLWQPEFLPWWTFLMPSPVTGLTGRLGRKTKPLPIPSRKAGNTLIPKW